MNSAPNCIELNGSCDNLTSSDLLPVLYNELRRLAAQKLCCERPGQTLQATALVHEAWLRMGGPDGHQWEGKAHFFAAAAETMRRILIENARRKKRLKNGGGLDRVELDAAGFACAHSPEELLDLDEALSRLESVDATGARVVKLRFFSGLTHPQIAEILGISLSTVERAWSFSRVWLFQQMSETSRVGKRKA
jgi:RNA polymerase sigma factor (TIGR02999 family)